MRNTNPRPWTWIAAGALLPDVVDKGLQWLGATPHGRFVGHSALLWATVILTSAPLRRRFLRAGSSMTALLTGVALHLLADLADDLIEALQWSGVAFSGWAGWPMTDPDQLHLPVPTLGGCWAFSPSVLELSVVAMLSAMLINTHPSPPSSSATRDRPAEPPYHL